MAEEKVPIEMFKNVETYESQPNDFSIRKALAPKPTEEPESDSNRMYMAEVAKIALSRSGIEKKVRLLNLLADTRPTDSAYYQVAKSVAQIVAAQEPDRLEKGDSDFLYLKVTRDDLDRIEAALKGQPVPAGVLLNKAISKALNQRRNE